MPKPRRLEIRVTEEIGALIDRARGDAKVQSWGERAFKQRLVRDGFLKDPDGSEQTASATGLAARPDAERLPGRPPSPGPSAAMPSGVVPGSVPSEDAGGYSREQAGPAPVDSKGTVAPSGGESVRPAAPDPESHEDPEYERRPPPRMTGGRRAR